MKTTNVLRLNLLAALIASLAPAASNAASTVNPGSLLIYRVGSGSALTTGAATAVFLDEYTTSGTLVQSIAVPTTVSGSNRALTASSTATSEGELTISPNGQYVALTGYNAATGTTGVAGTTGAATARTVGILNVATGIVDTSTALTDFASGNNPRSAVTTNGTDLWVGGAAGGVRYATKGATSSTQLSTTVANVRQVNVFNSQLYVSNSSGTTNRLGTVGVGLPTTAGQTITNLPGFSTNTGSPYSFFFADLSSSVAGVDTLYVADDGVGITKYSLNGGSWVSKGTIGAGADAYRGLTGYVDASGVRLFATGLGGSGTTGGGKLVSVLDGAGYDGTFTSLVNTLASATTNTAFRGVVYVPVVTAPVPLPAAAWLFGLAISSLVGVARRGAS